MVTPRLNTTTVNIQTPPQKLFTPESLRIRCSFLEFGRMPTRKMGMTCMKEVSTVIFSTPAKSPLRSVALDTSKRVESHVPL